jgi:hypothetical protein
MDFFKRLEGIFFGPKPVFGSLAEKAIWVDMLIVLLIALSIYSLLIAPYAKNEQLQMTKESTKLKERMGEDRFNQMVARMEGPTTTWQFIQTALGAPLYLVLALVLQSLVLLMFGRFVSTQGSFRQLFSALVHASAINVLLGNAVRLVLVLMRKSVMQTTTSLALLFPKMEVTSTAFMVLAQIDFFQLWLFGILAYGLAAIFKFDLKKALFISYTVWFLKALVNIGFGILAMSFLR